MNKFFKSREDYEDENEKDLHNVFPEFAKIKVHLKSLRLFTDSPIVCYDQDSKGLGAYAAAFWCRLYSMKDVTVLTDFAGLEKNLLCTSKPETVKQEALTQEEKDKQTFQKDFAFDKPGQGVTNSGRVVASIRSYGDRRNINKL